MRVDTNKKGVRFSWAILLIPALLIGAFFLFSNNPKALTEGIYCDAENFSSGIFTNNGNQFSTNCTQSSEEAYSGKYSCLCENEGIYGPNKVIEKLNEGDTLVYKIASKFLSTAKSRVVVTNDNGTYLSQDILHSKSWKESSFSFIIPHFTGNGPWKIYPYLFDGIGPVYFDDIQIKIKENKNASNIDFPNLHLQINNSNFKKIKAKRQDAFDKGLLISSRLDLVNADMRVDDVDFSCQTRLKGDLLDHLRDETWSFRIVLDGGKTWNEMNQFSIHSSKARCHLDEWIMHQVFKSEGIISPKYDFLRFKLNKEDKGVYGYEQHFDNEFLKENKRQIGPIIKHNDEGYWNNVAAGLKKFEWAASSQLELFNKVNSGNEKFMELYHYGHSQLDGFLKGRLTPQEVFDIEKMAKYYALIEICHGTHAQLMTNIRFYVNPSDGLLEPIGYDVFSGTYHHVTEEWRPIGQWQNSKNIHERSRRGDAYLVKLFANFDFYKTHLKWVEHYTHPAFIEKIKTDFASALSAREAFIKSDPQFSNYKHDFDQQFIKAKYTRAKLYPFPDVALKSYRSPVENEVFIQNFHYFPLKIVGYNSGKGTETLQEPILLEPYSPNTAIDMHSFIGTRKPKKIVYQVLGLDSLFYHDINNDLRPDAEVKSIKSQFSSYAQISGFENIDGVISTKQKDIVINRSILIEKGESLVLGAGTKINFTNGASLKINGKIIAEGLSDEKIIFSGNGSILVDKSKEENIFKHCIFNGLSYYNNRPSNLKGALNVLESQLQMRHCSWLNNNARTDLYLYNTNLALSGLTFENKNGKAMEVLYSQGRIDDVSISNYRFGGVSQTGGNITGKNWHFENTSGYCFQLTQFGLSTVSDFSFTSCDNVVYADRHSEMKLFGYDGLAEKVDVKIKTESKPITKVIITEASQAGEMKFIKSKSSLFRINGQKKEMK